MEGLNDAELRRYLARVHDRWPVARAMLGGARVDDLRGAGPQRERGPGYVLVLVSDGFDGMPWLERAYAAGALWDAGGMGAPVDVHCYTAEEYERKVETLKRVGEVARRGLDLLAAPAGPRPRETGLTLTAPRRGAKVWPMIEVIGPATVATYDGRVLELLDRTARAACTPARSGAPR